MKLIETPGLKRWLVKRDLIGQVRDLKQGSELHERLLEAGTNQEDLGLFLDSDRTRKTSGVLPKPEETQRKIDSLVESGGMVAGGAALRSYLFMEPARDCDIFFNNLVAYARATIETRRFPGIDCCLYDIKPYEDFDLNLSMIAYGKYGYDISAEYSVAVNGGICEIRAERIIHPVATLRRVAKYGQTYKIKFLASQIIGLAAIYGVPDDATKEALKFT